MSRKYKTCPNRHCLNGWIFYNGGKDRKRCGTCGGSGVVDKD